MKTKGNRIKRNVGRIEFIACRKTITSMQELGYDAKMIHAKLRNEGRISMSYSTLCYHLARYKEQEAQEKAEVIAQSSLENANTAISLLTPQQRGFVVNKVPHTDEII